MLAALQGGVCGVCLESGMAHRATPRHAAPHCTASHRTTAHHAAPRRITPHARTAPHQAAPHHATPHCCTMSSWSSWSNPTLFFEAELKQALKESKREAHTRLANG